MEIDLLVIKKDRDIQVANKIGKIFRKYNKLEYKSPDDSLNIDAFYKAGAYAGLYKAYGETVDERRACDITVSMIREARPDDLFAYFKNHGIHMENPYRRIYYVMGSVCFQSRSL